MREKIFNEEGNFEDEEVNFEDEEAMGQSSDSDDRPEKLNAFVCGLSGNKSPRQDMNRGLDGSRFIDAKRCIEKTCMQKHSDNELTIQNWSFFNFQRNLAQYLDGFSELRTSHSLSIICRSPSRFRIPLNLRSSRFLFESGNRCRRTRSTNDLGNFIVEYASPEGPRNVIINPYRKWIIDTTEGNDKMNNIMGQSLILNLGDAESNLKLNRAISANARETRSSSQKSLPNRPGDISPEKSKLEVILPNRTRSALVTYDEMSKPCSSSISIGSSANCTISKGLLHFIWKGGVPFFVFMIDDEGEEIYVANPRKVSSSDDKTLDYIYLFHSCHYHHYQKGMGRFGNNTSELVGKMKVSSSLIFNSNRSRFMENEFVLFATSEDHARETQNLKIKGLPKKMSNIFRINYSSKHKPGPQRGSECNFEELFPCVNKSNMFDKSKVMDLVEDIVPSNLELAAIIIRDHQNEHSKETVVGGWGLKFLQKTTNLVDASLGASYCPATCRATSMGGKNGNCRSIDVLVPAGFHGGPLTTIGGPSSLTERWRSGGLCDCGGWDIGCPLTVLNSKSTDTGTSCSQDPGEDKKSFTLFKEGTKQGEPTLRMVNKQEGLYFVYFQSSLSALQSFSIAVAMIHAQTPTICDNCKYCT